MKTELTRMKYFGVFIPDRECVEALQQASNQRFVHTNPRFVYWLKLIAVVRSLKQT